MKYLPLLLIAALLSACDTSEEDRNFFYSGWMKPETDANRRIYGGGTLNKIPPPAPQAEEN